jgi:hypothetical protein
MQRLEIFTSWVLLIIVRKAFCLGSTFILVLKNFFTMLTSVKLVCADSSSVSSMSGGTQLEKNRNMKVKFSSG